MRYLALTGALTLGLIALTTVTGQPGKGLAKQKGWYDNLETARAAARKSGKPLLVVFRCEP